MKIIVAGGRNYSGTETGASERSSIIKALLGRASEVVSGGAPGADALGEAYAQEFGLPVRRFPADWNRHGKAAGPIRNRKMAEYADAVVLLPGGRGTASMADEARKLCLWIFDLRGQS